MTPPPKDSDWFNLLTLDPGCQLGNYRISRFLGKGTTGSVYLALDLLLGRKVAIKVQPAIFSLDEESREAFVQEARLASRLSHPNCVTVHHLAYFKGRYFIVMEYIAGDSLEEVFRRRGGLKRNTWLHYAIQLADALCAAHKRNVIHGDLKPGNILVTPQNQIKVIDFGSALLSSPPERRHPDRRQSAGTRDYTAPEIFRGHHPDALTDIFSFGVLLLQMTGALERSNLQIDGTLSLGVRDLNAVVQRCLKTSRRQRFSDMKQLADALRALAHNS